MLTLSLSLALTLLAEPDSNRPLELDFDADAPDSTFLETMPPSIRDGVEPHLSKFGMKLDKAATKRISIHFTTELVSTGNTVSIVPYVNDAVALDVEPGHVTCFCKEDVLVERVVAETLRVAKDLNQLEEENTPITPAKSENPADAVPTFDRDSTPRPRTEKVLLGSGISALSVGLAAVVAGSVLLSKPQDEDIEWFLREDENGNNYLVSVHNFHLSREQNIGVALTSLGGVAVIGGSVLIGIGARRRKQRSRHAFMVTPALHSLMISGRF